MSFNRIKVRRQKLAAFMLLRSVGGMVSFGYRFLFSVSIAMVLSSVGHAQTDEAVSVQDVTRHFRSSQQALTEAYQMKSIERALRALSKADESLRQAKSVLSSRKPKSAAETRMKSRLMYKLDQDIAFLNQLRSDLGMAEVDGFDSYIQLRRSLLQTPDQRSQVVKMDHQILLMLESRKFN